MLMGMHMPSAEEVVAYFDYDNDGRLSKDEAYDSAVAQYEGWGIFDFSD